MCFLFFHFLPSFHREVGCDSNHQNPMCRNLPFGGRARRDKMCVFQKGERAGVTTNIYSRENVRKTKKGSTNFKEKGFESCLSVGKVLAPHASITRDDSL